MTNQMSEPDALRHLSYQLHKVAPAMDQKTLHKLEKVINTRALTILNDAAPK